jgi:MFS family permease
MDNVAEVFFARDTLRADGWGYGLLASMWIVGIVIGASQIGRRLAKDRLVPALILASLAGGLAVAAAAALPVLAFALAMFVVGGAANGIQSVSVRSLIVHRVEDRYRGRVFAAYGGIANGMQIGAMAIAGGLVVALGGRATLLVGGVGCAVAGAVGLLWYRALPPSVRAMPETASGSAGDVIVDIAEPGDHMVHLPEADPVKDNSSNP